MVDIKDISNETIYSTAINRGSKGRYVLMKEHSITLKFSLPEPLNFPLGSYVDDADLGVFEVTKEQKPKYNTSTGGYDFNLRLDAHYWKWANKIFKYTPETPGNEASWSLTATLDVHMGIFLRNLEALGYKWRGLSYTFTIDSTVENAAKLITYDNTNGIDALTMMAEAWGCEWWVEDNVIHFGRCEYGNTPVELSLESNCENMVATESKNEYATRLYVFGSTRNIPVNYRPIDESVMVNGVVQRRLMLPSGIPYIDAKPNQSQEQSVESVVVLDNVYPRTDGTISSVDEYDDTVTDEGTGEESTETFYRFSDMGFTFSSEYALPGEELRVTFQSGRLNGMDFGVAFNPLALPEKLDDGTWNTDAQLFEIVANEDYGRKLPDETLKPAVGDKYVLYGWDATKIADLGLIASAEEELLVEGQKAMDKLKIDPNVYTCKLMSDWVKEKGTTTEGKFVLPLTVGDRVTLQNAAFFADGSRQSRIIGVEYNLDIPYDTPTYTVGETTAYSRIGKLESEVRNLTLAGQTYQGMGGGSSIYLITSNDSTVPSNRNAFSALRSMQEFINKKSDDRAKGKIASDKGFEVGKYLAGASGGIFGIDAATGDSFAEVFKLFVRGKAYFETLTVINAEALAGEQRITPGGGIKCTSVAEKGLVEVTKTRPKTDAEGNPVLDSDGNAVMEEYVEMVDNGVPDGVYRCYFLSEQDGEKTETKIIAGDQAISQMFNAKTGTANKVSNHRYWRLVTAVSNDAYADASGNRYGYVDLSKADCEAGSDAPQSGDGIVQFGNRTDASRQAAMAFSTVSADAPSTKLYVGIGAGETNAEHYSLTDKAVISQGYDHVSGHAYLNCYGDAYIGDPDGTTFIKYDQATKQLDVKAKLSILPTSTIGDKPIDDYIGDKVHSLGAAYVLVLDSEMASVSADAAGNVTGSYPTSNASVYQGPDKVTQGVAYSIAKKSGITSAAITSAGAITMGGMTADRAEITVQAVVGSTTLTAVMTIAKVRAGADGAAAVTYDVVPSTRVVTRSMTGALSAATVTATTYKTTGGTSRTTTNDHVLTYRRLPDGATGTLTRTNGTSGAVSMLAATEEVVFELKKADGTLLDRETVTVLSDASDLEMSSRNLLINSSEFTVTANTINYAFRQFDLPIPLKAGDYVALMVEGITNVAGSPTSYSCGVWNEAVTQNINDGGYPKTITASRNTAVFKITADEAKPRFLIYAGVAGSTAGNEVSFKRAILVKGNVPMRSWTCAPEDLAAQLGEMDYIRRAIRDGASQFQGGLMMSSLLRLGSWDLSDPSNPHMLNVYSGLNGVYASDRSIAIFFGGEMLDKEDYYTFDKNTSSWVQKPNVTPPSRIAKGLDRMDGSGYRANGSIWWDAQGHVYADPLSFFVGEDTVGFVSALFSFRKADASPGRPTSWTEVSHVIPNKPFSKLDLGTSAAYGTLSRSNGAFALDSLTASGIIRAGSLHALSGQVEITGSTPYIDFHFGNTTTDYTSRIIETSSGKLSINDTIFASMSGNVGFGTANPQARVHIEGALRIGGGTISWDATNNMFKFDKGVYSMGDVTALGVQQGVSGGGSGGGGGTVALNRLDAWADYVPSMASTHVLSAGLGYDLHTRVNANATAIASLSSQLSQMGGSISLTTQMTGSGNAVTEINRSGTVLVATRGATFLTHTPFNGGLVPINVLSTWGNSVGEFVGGWTDGTNSSAFKFKKDNPSAGKMSMLIDGTVYINEGLDAVASQAWVNSRGFLTSHQPLNHLNINDVRGEARLPSFFEIKKLTAWFNNAGTPREDWYSGIHMKGWTSDYASWAICAGSAVNVNDKNLYFRVGINSTWEAWQTVLTSANYSSILDGRYVTLNTAQTITGEKKFVGGNLKVAGNNANYIPVLRSTNTAIPTSARDYAWQFYHWAQDGANRGLSIWSYDGDSKVYNHVATFKASPSNALIVNGAIAKSGGTSSQFLMADGSVKALTDITSAYVTALGTSRNYLTWTKNGVVNNITVPFATAASVLNSSGRLSAISNAKHGVGIRLYEAYGVSANYPTNYGNVLAAQGDAAIGAGELLMGWSGSDGGYAGLYYRNCRDHANTWSPWVTILDSSNFNSVIGSGLTAYVKKAGDTMTGALNFGSTNARITNNGSYLVLSGGDGISKMVIGTNEVRRSYETETVFLGTSDCRWSNVYATTINVSSTALVSNLNADMLDGKHNGSLTAKLINERDNIGTTNITTPGFYFFDGDPANISDGSPTPGNSWNFSMMVLGHVSSRIKQLALEYQSGRAYTRIHMNSWSDWKPIAFLTDNVASATKLQTARTLWGQSFDGTGNVSGKMTGASRIANNDTSAPYLMVSGTPSNAGNLGTAVGVGSSPDSYGLFIWGEGTGKGHIQVGRKDGTSTAYNLILQEFGGMVGIGTTSPTKKLSVNGWVGTIGDTGWYSITHMGGWYMADSTWIRSYNNKSIYSGSGIIRSDKYFTREDYNPFSWNSGYGAYNTSVPNDNAQTPLLVAYRSGQTPEATGANRLFAMELLNSGASLRLCLGGAHKMAINKGGLIEIPGSLKIGDVTISWDATNGMLKFDKGVYSMGDVTSLGMQKSTLSQDIGSSLLPTADASFDLGSSAKRWSNVHAETVTADYLMPASSSADIGSKANANKRFYHIYSRYGLVASSDSTYADRPNNVSAAGGTYGAGYVELAMDTPFIDFHKTGYVADYHARIILTSTSLLEFQGAAISAHGTLTTSDERLKQRIADVALDVETVAASPMFTFKRLDNGERDFGSSAQYWQRHLPDAVRELSTGYLSMCYDKVALASAQAACRETVALKRRIKMLEEEVERLKNERRA